MLKKTINKISLFFSIIILLALISNCTKQSPVVKIIPEPAEMTISSGTYRIPAKVMIFIDKESTDLMPVAEYLSGRIQASCDVRVEFEDVEENPGKGIYLNSGTTIFSANHEAYELETTSKGISILANTPKGIFYGVQTLLQLLPAENRLVRYSVRRKILKMIGFPQRKQ